MPIFFLPVPPAWSVGRAYVSICWMNEHEPELLGSLASWADSWLGHLPAARPIWHHLGCTADSRRPLTAPFRVMLCSLPWTVSLAGTRAGQGESVGSGPVGKASLSLIRGTDSRAGKTVKRTKCRCVPPSLCSQLQAPLLPPIVPLDLFVPSDFPSPPHGTSSTDPSLRQQS